MALNKLTQFAKHSLRRCYIRKLLLRQDLMRMQLKKGKIMGLGGGVFFFSFSLKVFFIEENPLWEMTRCGAPIVQGVRLSWTGLLFKMSVKWNYCMCLLATAVTAFQYTILNCSE